MNPGRSDTFRIFCLVSVLINPIYKTLSTLMMTHITILGLDVPVFRMGNVVNVSEPRFQQPQMGQMGQYQQLQDRVIDLTVEINGSSMTYVVPESRDVAMSNNITLACSVDPIMNQLNAAKRTSSDILDSIDKHRRTLEACDSILEEINPAFKQTKDQDRKIKNLEEKVDRMGSSFDELKELLIKKLG